MIDRRYHRLACAAVLCVSGFAAAQHYPSRPVRLLVPLTPGGGADIIGRVVMQKLSDSLGQQFVVDNRPSASGSIAYELTARANPDGHTIAFGTGSMVTSQLLYKVPYDILRDFASVSQLSAQPYVFVVNPNLTVRNIQEFVAIGKAKSRPLNFASSGIGGLIHLTGELFKLGAGIEMTHVPYKGMATAYPDLISGQVQLAIGALLSASPHVKSGRLRLIGVTSSKRNAAIPDVPTIAESGVPDFDVTQWYSIMTPAKTPPAVIALLNREIIKALQSADVKARLEADGSEATGSTPEALTAHVRAELAKWSKVIKAAGIRRE